jgi:Tfp pilus assembly protein PilN
MNEIDLIPRSYRDMVRMRRTVRIALAALALACITGGALLGMLRWQLHVESAQLAGVRSAAASASALRAQVSALTKEKARLEQARAALAALRGSDEILSTVNAIDAALNGGVWLTSIRYMRGGREAADTPKAPASGVNPDTAAAGDAAPLPPSRIEIKGGALDHRVLADFMKALSDQPGTSNVRFIQSSASAGANTEMVEFSASAALVPVPEVAQ